MTTSTPEEFPIERVRRSHGAVDPRREVERLLSDGGERFATVLDADGAPAYYPTCRAPALPPSLTAARQRARTALPRI